MTDYYQALGVQQGASDDDIKRAYRKLAMKHHPDRTGGDDTEFKKIQEAYATLSDPQKRAQYDNPQPQGFPGGFEFHGGMPPGFEDIMSQMFGNGGNPFFGQGFRQRAPQRNQDLNLDTTITLLEAFTGKEIMANVRLPSGREQVLEIKIPPGIQTGQRLRLQGLGDDQYPQLPRGDLFVGIRVLPDSRYERRGDDLYRNISISVWDAMLGADIIIDTIDNKQLTVTVPEGSQPNSVLRLTGYGMPNVNDARFKGNLMLNLEITIPRFLSDDQKTVIRQIKN